MQILKPARAVLVEVIFGDVRVTEISAHATIIILDEAAPSAIDAVQPAGDVAPIAAGSATMAGPLKAEGWVRESWAADAPKGKPKMQLNAAVPARVAPKTRRSQVLAGVTVAPQSVETIATSIKLDRCRTGITLANLAAAGLIKRVDKGMYALMRATPAPELGTPETKLAPKAVDDFAASTPAAFASTPKPRVVTFGDKA